APRHCMSPPRKRGPIVRAEHREVDGGETWGTERAFGVPLPRRGEGTGVGDRLGHQAFGAGRAPWPCPRHRMSPVAPSPLQVTLAPTHWMSPPRKRGPIVRESREVDGGE